MRILPVNHKKALFWKFPWWQGSLNFSRNGPTFWWQALAIIVTKHTKSGMWSEILLFTLITSGDSFYPLVSSLLHIYVYICVRTYICMFTGNISKTMFYKIYIDLKSWLRTNAVQWNNTNTETSSSNKNTKMQKYRFIAKVFIFAT